MWDLFYFKILLTRISYPPNFSALSWTCYTYNFSQSFMYLFCIYDYMWLLYMSESFSKKKKKKKTLHVGKNKKCLNTRMSAYAGVYIIVILSCFSYAIYNHILVLWNSLNLVLRPMHFVICWRLEALVRAIKILLLLPGCLRHRK